jgi:hypothetical protein
MNTSETKVDVLAVMDAARWCPRMQPQIAVELGQARAAVAELIEALRNIVALDPATDSDSGRNEWGEAECFDKAQEIASTALARIGGAA